MDTLRPAALTATLRRKRKQAASWLQHMPNILNEEDCSHCIIKYLIVFGFNYVLFIFCGALLAIGVWAYTEKDWPFIFENSSVLLQIPDPALVCVIVGFCGFILGFFGWLGALRESVCLLATFSVIVGFLFVGEVLLIILAFAFDDWVIEFTKKQIRMTLGFYREDPDLQSAIDWVQGDWLFCCGVDGPNDWEYNEYFNCTSPSFERCGVPYSCCIVDSNAEINLQCGFGIRDLELFPNGLRTIYTQGCFEQSQAWIQTNLTAIVSILVAVLIFQLVSLIFATSLCADIRRNKRAAAMWAKQQIRREEAEMRRSTPQRDNNVERQIWEAYDDEPMEISTAPSTPSTPATPRPSTVNAAATRAPDTQVASATTGQLKMAVAQFKRNRIGGRYQIKPPSDAIRTIDWSVAQRNQPDPTSVQLTDVSDVSWITSTYT